MPRMGIEPQVYKALHKLKKCFMRAKCTKAREAVMVQGLEILESYINSHEITTDFFLNALKEIEEWDWEQQLAEIRNLPEKAK